MSLRSSEVPDAVASERTRRVRVATQVDCRRPCVCGEMSSQAVRLPHVVYRLTEGTFQAYTYHDFMTN